MKNIKKSSAVFVAAVLAIFAGALASCTQEQANEILRIAAKQINIFEVGASGDLARVTEFEGINVGDVKTLSVEVLPADATNKVVLWSSSNESVVSIDVAGTLEAKGPGNATITVSAGGAKAALAVSVAYKLTDEAGLRAIANNLAGYYVLQNDISLTLEWTPLGSASTPFTGTLDGAGNSVTNLWIDQPRITTSGMGFITENHGTVKNIGLELASQGVRGGDFLGALVGRNAGYVSGSVSGAGKVTGLGSYTGGLVGDNIRGMVIGYATVAVDGALIGGTGGLVGNSEGTVIGYATGAVTAPFNAGGLIGAVTGGSVNGYARGAVMGKDDVNSQRNVNNIGGLIGSIGSGINGGDIFGYARGAVSTDRTITTSIGPAVGNGNAALAANLYFSGNSGESGVTAPTGVTPNIFGSRVTVVASESYSFTAATFSNLASSHWTRYGGKWPSINFPADPKTNARQSIFDDVLGDKQPIDP